MSLYLDASVVVPLFVIEQRSAALTDWMTTIDTSLIVSDLVITEVGAVTSRLVRKNALLPEQADAVLRRFDTWRAEVTEGLENVPADVRLAGLLVRTPLPKLLAADAIHLATCRRLELTLITHDIGLATIAKRESIACLQPR